MTLIADQGWALHYTIGRLLAAQVRSGDLVHMPGGRGDVIVLAGRAPQRAKDYGNIKVRDAIAPGGQGFDMRPASLGMVWISASGGWSELPA